jgi:hypothetical protein
MSSDNWNPSVDECQFSSDFFNHWSETVDRLVSDIISGLSKLRCSGNKENLDNVYSMMLETMRNALLHVSPLKGFYKCPFKDLVRSSIIKDLACMIKVDPRIAEMTNSYGNLMDWARKWRILDVWRAVLETAGLNVQRLSQRAWVQDRHLYPRNLDGKSSKHRKKSHGCKRKEVVSQNEKLFDTDESEDDSASEAGSDEIEELRILIEDLEKKIEEIEGREKRSKHNLSEKSNLNSIEPFISIQHPAWTLLSYGLIYC